MHWTYGVLSSGTSLRYAWGAALIGLLGLCGCGSTPVGDEAEALEPAGVYRLERRYRVEARVFKAIDETWYDSPWFAPWISDEVMVVLRDPERREMTVSRVFEDVDSGEHRSFSPQESCILPADLISSGPNGEYGAKHFAHWGPWVCEAGGLPGPFSFNVEMYEADSDF